MVRVFVSATVAVIVQVRTPTASVATELLHVVVVPVPEVTEAAVATLAIATLSESFTVIVQVAEPTPFALGEPEQVKVEVVELGVCAEKATVVDLVFNSVGALIVSVFVAATVE